MRIRVSQTACIAFLPILYYLANFYRVWKNQVLLPFAVLAATGAIGLLLVLCSKPSRLAYFYRFYLLFGFFLVLNCFFVGNVDIVDAASGVFLIGVSGIMLLYRWSAKQAGIAFYLIFFVMTIRTVTSPRAILGVSSNNYVSVLLLLAEILYYMPFEWNGRKMKLFDMLPAVLSFWLSVVVAGRGGILATGLLMICILSIYILGKKVKKREKIAVILLAVLVVAAALAFDASGIFARLLKLGAFQSKGVDSTIRIRMWRAYLAKTIHSFKYILLGTPLSDLPILEKFNGNVHNSFIQLHAVGGLFSLAVFLLYCAKAVCLSLKKRRYLLLSMQAALLLRGLTDRFIFGQYGMPVMMLLVLFPLQMYGRRKGGGCEPTKTGDM